MARRTFRHGDYLAVDDISGQTHLASEMRLNWKGQFVHKKNWEPRHPQDFVRTRNDDQSVPVARPRPDDVFVDVDFFTGYMQTEASQPLLNEDGKELIW